YLIYDNQAGPNAETIATIRAAHVAAIVREAETSESSENLRPILKRAQGHNMDVRIVPALEDAELSDGGKEPSSLTRAIAAALRDTWGIVPTLQGNSIAVRINDNVTLRFKLLSRNGFHNLVVVQTTCAVAIITLIILFLSIYALRWITSPLSSI